MKHFFGRLLFLLCAVSVLFFSTAKKIKADICSPSYTSPVTKGQQFTISFDSLDQNLINSCPSCYQIRGCNTDWGGTYGCWGYSTFEIPATLNASTRTIVAILNRDARLTFWLEKKPSLSGSFSKVCGGEWRVEVSAPPSTCGAGTFKVVGLRDGKEIDNYLPTDDLVLKFDGHYTSNFVNNGGYNLTRESATDRSNSVTLKGFLQLVGVADGTLRLDTNQFQANVPLGKLPLGDYRIVVSDGLSTGYRYCDDFVFRVTSDGNNEVNPNYGKPEEFQLCTQAGSSHPDGERHDDFIACKTCFDSKGIWTGVGCIPYSDSAQTVRAFITLGLGISGAVVIMMVLAGGFLMTTSQGDPKRVDEAKSLITSAIAGIFFLIFSVSILQFIGVKILQIPGFG